MIDIDTYLKNFFKGNKVNLSLDGMKYFMDKYDNFQNKMKFIHIAGTNGKGSCTEMMSNILIKQGYKVGKFISPHLIRYNERISINGIDINDNDLSILIEELQPLIDEYNRENKIPITLFELLTTIALLYFYRNDVDFVVLETGLGGLNDCTNIISSPLVSIITSIWYDHMHILGDTLTEIAYQKAGIIKENSHTVYFSSSQEIDNIFIDTCNKKSNKLHLLTKDLIKNYGYNDDFQFFDYKNLNKIEVNLKGLKQVQNAALCIEATNILNDLGYKVSEKSLRSGLKTVIHKARMEKVCDNPTIIYDGAHNEAAILNLQNTINMYYKDLKRTYIVSILKTKPYEKIISLLMQDKSANFIFTSGNDKNKYASSKELYDIALKYRDNQNIQKNNLTDSIKSIFNNPISDIYFITGSFYIYPDVIKEIQNV